MKKLLILLVKINLHLSKFPLISLKNSIFATTFTRYENK